MIEVQGENGESLVYDGATVAKFRHGGNEEVARNPASTYRQCDVKVKKRKKKHPEQLYDVLLACSSFMSLTVTETNRPKLDELIAVLEAAQA
jgi:hypothetical protein